MWSLQQKTDGTVFLTFDRSKRYNHQNRGIWEWIGRQDNEQIQKYIRINQIAGHLVANDDEGSVRALILE